MRSVTMPPPNPVYMGDGTMQQLLTIERLKTDKVAQGMIRRLNQENPLVTAPDDKAPQIHRQDSSMHERGSQIA
jgi:hypothetical protein